MAIPDSVQTLSGAFSFGILLQAATTALLLFAKGHASTLLQDPQRLVLIIFLAATALWAQVDFINFLIPSTSLEICQVTIIASTLFDQIARISFGGFLLWYVARTKKTSTEKYIVGALLSIRVVSGGIFTGFARPEFAPVCVARSQLLPASIIVIGIDFAILGIAIVRIFTLGLYRNPQNVQTNAKPEQSKALMLCTLGFFVWTATSIAMLLGLDSIILLVRTSIPATGLLVLILILTFYAGALVLPQVDDSVTPEARSPFVVNQPPMSDPSGAYNGSPFPSTDYLKTTSLFVVNPSNSPQNSGNLIVPKEIDDYGLAKYGGYSVQAAGTNKDLPGIKPESKRGSNGIFESMIGAPVGAGAISAATFSANRAQMPTTPTTRVNVVDRRDLRTARTIPGAETSLNTGMFGKQKKSKNVSIRKLEISAPMMSTSEEGAANAFAKMQTIDLQTAAINERERRAGAGNKRLIAMRPAPAPPMSTSEAFQRSISTKRKQTPLEVPRDIPTKMVGKSEDSMSVNINGSSTSASLSPGRDDIRRRSPRGVTATAQGTERLGGLPSNPRSRMLKSNPVRAETVMFINDIVYDNPSVVKTIIMNTSTAYADSKGFAGSPESRDAPQKPLSSSEPVIHRPRPYTRASNRALFPSEATPTYDHKRSKSGSSIVSRKSILRSSPGSPTELPPLPTLPMNAKALTRILPNDTRSMTVEEKIELLFPAPPCTVIRNKRRSSVPSVSCIPSESSTIDNRIKEAYKEVAQSWRVSQRTSSISSTSHGDGSSSGKDNAKQEELYQLSAKTYSPAKTPSSRMKPRAEKTSLKRTSTAGSGVNDSRPKKTESSSDRSSYGTVWASLHSPVAPVYLAHTQVNPVFVEQRQDDSQTLSGAQELLNRLGGSASESQQENQNPRSSFYYTSTENRSSVLQVTQVARKVPAQNGQSWHKRIGDQLPTFSERRKLSRSRSRTMPPPVPLILNSRNHQSSSIVHQPEPEVIDSPERAYREIQAQLKKLEESSRGSVASFTRRQPNETGRDSTSDDSRFGLLANIEKEMGLQENQWMQMQHNLARDSNMTLSPPPEEESDAILVPSISESNSRASSRSSLSRTVSRRAHIRSGMKQHSKEDGSVRSNSTQSSEVSRASAWQQRLAEAQMEYMDNAPALLGKQTFNFFSAAKMQVNSPTPPDSLKSSSESDSEISSDYEDDTEGESVADTGLPPHKVELWKPTNEISDAKVGGIWSKPRKTLSTPQWYSIPPAQDIRPAQRRLHLPLTLQSAQLWSMPASYRSRERIGLWGSEKSRPKSIMTRQKPARKSKRITFLPDIVESPSPLPFKRDTLGIFQFPWGEKSESAVYRPTAVIMSGSKASTYTGQNVTQNTGLEEYSEDSYSFFDDYDEEFEDDPEQELTSDEDEFDESTLWEIASLLNSENVPSRDSIFPQPNIIEDYDDDESSEDEGTAIVPQKASLAPFAKFMPIQPLMPRSPLPTLLWTFTRDADLSSVNPGLPQPPAHVWQEYVMSTTAVVLSRRCEPSRITSLESSNLWAMAIKMVNEVPQFLWSAKSSELNSKAKLWSMTSSEKQTKVWLADGMKDEISFKRSNGRTISKPRQLNMMLPVLESKYLWSTKQTSSSGLDVRQTTDLWTSTRRDIVDRSDKIPKNPRSGLWTLRKADLSVNASGLFAKVHRSDLRQSDFRTTHQLPATIPTLRNNRSMSHPLSALTTQDLWSPNNEQDLERHWICESSAQTTSPSVYSEASSKQSSPVSDNGSIKTVSTKTSSIWGSYAVSDTTAAWWDSGLAEQKSSILQRPSQEQLQSASPLTHSSEEVSNLKRESKVLASRNMWEAMASNDLPFRQSQLVSKIPVSRFRSDKSKASKRLARGASAAEWNAALTEAIVAGTSRVHRPAASPKAWNTALEEAIQKGRVAPIKSLAIQPKYDPAVCHPVFFIQSMVTDLENVHPAAIGYVSRSDQPKYDPAVRHPVFFTQSMVTDIENVHPAAIGHVSRSNIAAPVIRSTQMWMPSTLRPTTISDKDVKAMWSKDVSASGPAMETSHHFIATAVPKKSYAKRSPDLPVLTSTSLFQSSVSAIVAEKHWLKATREEKVINTHSTSMTWSMMGTAVPLEPKSIQPGTMLWAPRANGFVSVTATPALGPTSESTLSPARKRAPRLPADSQLAPLESKDLWKYSSGSYNRKPESRNWMIERRARKVEFRY